MQAQLQRAHETPCVQVPSANCQDAPMRLYITDTCITMQQCVWTPHLLLLVHSVQFCTLIATSTAELHNHTPNDEVTGILLEGTRFFERLLGSEPAARVESQQRARSARTHLAVKQGTGRFSRPFTRNLGQPGVQWSSLVGSVPCWASVSTVHHTWKQAQTCLHVGRHEPHPRTKETETETHSGLA